MDGYQSIFNSTSLLTNSTDIIFSDLTPDTLLYINSTLNPASVTCGTSLSFTGGTLNTVQGIRTIDSPTFAGITIGTITGILKASAGVISQATQDVDYQRPLSGFTNLSYAAGVLNLASTITGLTSISTSALTVINKKIKLDDGASSYNCIVGDANTGAGITTGTANLLFGAGTGRQITTGGFNCLMGSLIAYIGNPSSCVVVGCNSLNNTGSSTTQVTAIGTSCGITMTGNSNTVIGFEAGRLTTSGANNTFIGTTAGRSNITGSGSVFIGYQAGYNELNSNKLYIANSGTSTPLIYGDFNTAALTINGTAAITGTTTLATSLNGILKASSGTVSQAAAGTDYEYPISAGTSLQYWRGDKTFQTLNTSVVPEVTNLYYTDTRARLSLSAGTGITYDSSTGIISTGSGFVTSIAGTANQINASASTGAVTLSLPSAVTFPGSAASTTFLTANSYLNVGTYAGIGTSADSNVTLQLSRSFTGTAVASYGFISTGTITAYNLNSPINHYGFYHTITFKPVAFNTSLTAYGLYNACSIDTTNKAVSTFYGSYFTTSLTASNTATNSYSLYAVAPQFGTNRAAIYTDDLQIGGSILSGSSKTGLLYVDGRISVGGSTNNTDNTLIVNRSFTTSAISAAVASFTGSITAFNSAAGISLRAFELTNTLISSALNTAAAYVNLYSSPTINATASTVTTAYGIYSVIPGGSGTVISAYSGFFGLPSMGSTDKVALYTESIYCGASAGSPGIQTAGTITATGNATFNNMNLSGFTFRSSLACAAQTVSGSWKGMNSNVSSTFYYSRFGYIVMLTIPVWNYPNTSTTQTPYFDANPSGWAPTVNSIFRVCANNANAYVGCNILVNTNCTVYLYGPTYNNKPSITNGGQAFPAAIQISWGVY